jgi:hypothetical protein
VFDDAALEVDEGGDAAATGPFDSGLEGLDGFDVVELGDQPESFLEQVGMVQPGVGLGDPGQFGLLPGGEVLGFFHNAYRACLSAFAFPAASGVRATTGSGRRGRLVGGGRRSRPGGGRRRGPRWPT